MQISLKIFGLFFIGSVALNIYQYQQMKNLSLAPEEELRGELKKVKYTHISEIKSSTEPKIAPNIPIDSTSASYNPVTIDKGDPQTQANNVSHNESDEYSEAFFEYEFSFYLDDEVKEAIQNISSVDKIRIVNMFNNAEVRAQDLELESTFSNVFAKYKESIVSGSEEVRCNSLGCYSSYILSDPKASTHLFLDWPNTEGKGFGTNVYYPDGTVRMIDFNFYP